MEKKERSHHLHVSEEKKKKSSCAAFFTADVTMAPYQVDVEVLLIGCKEPR